MPMQAHRGAGVQLQPKREPTTEGGSCKQDCLAVSPPADKVTYTGNALFKS